MTDGFEVNDVTDGDPLTVTGIPATLELTHPVVFHDNIIKPFPEL